MNIGQVKLLCWLAVAAMAGYLGWDVYQFFEVGRKELVYPSPEEQRAVLQDVEVPEPRERDLVEYEKVQEAFFELNWTGYVPPPPKVTTGGDTGPKKPVHTPVAQLLTVLLIQYVGTSEAESLVLVRYKGASAALAKDPHAVLRVGDALPGKFSNIQVSRIVPEYVEFSFEVAEGEEEREPERVTPPEYESDKEQGPIRIAQVGPDGIALMPNEESFIPVLPQQERFSPKTTFERRKNQFELGTQDVARFNRDYSSILTREVRTSRYRDPKTGRYAGIEVKELLGGSIVEQHGLQQGDIVLSINGEPVTSTNEAISYVKTHADTTSHWVAVVLRQGKEVTLTYDYTPPAK